MPAHIQRHTDGLIWTVHESMAIWSMYPEHTLVFRPESFCLSCCYLWMLKGESAMWEQWSTPNWGLTWMQCKCAMQNAHRSRGICTSSTSVTPAVRATHVPTAGCTTHRQRQATQRTPDQWQRRTARAAARANNFAKSWPWIDAVPAAGLQTAFTPSFKCRICWPFFCTVVFFGLNEGSMTLMMVMMKKMMMMMRRRRRRREEGGGGGWGRRRRRMRKEEKRKMGRRIRRRRRWWR